MPHGDHEMNWVNAIKGTDQISCPFDYAAQLTEIMLLGIVSLRANSKLHYDAATMRVTNNVAANDFLTREYRRGGRFKLGARGSGLGGSVVSAFARSAPADPP